jgi:hypothetical protein
METQDMEATRCREEEASPLTDMVRVVHTGEEGMEGSLTHMVQDKHAITIMGKLEHSRIMRHKVMAVLRELMPQQVDMEDTVREVSIIMAVVLSYQYGSRFKRSTQTLSLSCIYIAGRWLALCPCTWRSCWAGVALSSRTDRCSSSSEEPIPST